VPPPASGPAAGGLSPQQAMVAAIQAQLYGTVYNRPFDTRGFAAPATFTNLADQLSRVNAGRERWDHGWQVYETAPNGVIQAHKHGKAQMFYPGQYQPLGAAPGAQPALQNGAYVNVYLAKEMRTHQEGFYIVLGEQVQPWYEQVTLVRIYWHVDPTGAETLVREITRRFNRFQVPFRFKCLSYRELYDRYDSAVLFVGRRQWDITALLLRELYGKVKDRLQPDVPLFTKRIAPGLALAEDPGNGESFGTSRCRLVAEGIWNAYARGQQSEPARIEDITAAFARAGIAPDRPWLTSGSVDLYDLHVE
jgi:HopA1 effector protein family